MFNLFQTKNKTDSKQVSSIESVNDVNIKQKFDNDIKKNKEIIVEEKYDSPLDSILKLAPFIKALLGEKVGFYVSDRDNYTYCQHGKIQLNLHA